MKAELTTPLESLRVGERFETLATGARGLRGPATGVSGRGIVCSLEYTNGRVVEKNLAPEMLVRVTRDVPTIAEARR